MKSNKYFVNYIIYFYQMKKKHFYRTYLKKYIFFGYFDVGPVYYYIIIFVFKLNFFPQTNFFNYY